jgi:hypothetical protein
MRYMNITLPVSKVRPYMQKKLQKLQEIVVENEQKMQQLEENYQEDLRLYRETPWYKKLFRSQPEPPSAGYLTLYSIHENWKRHAEERAKEVRILLSTLDYASEVLLTDKDIEYYGIDLSKEGIEKVRESLRGA